MSGYGFHWTPCPGSGGRSGAIGALAVVLVAAAAIRAAWHAIVDAVEITALVVVSAAGLFLLGFLTYAAVTIRRHVITRRPAPELGPRWAVRTQVLDGDRAELPAPGTRPHLRIVPGPIDKEPVK
jgi:hypothetical protein